MDADEIARLQAEVDRVFAGLLTTFQALEADRVTDLRAVVIALTRHLGLLIGFVALDGRLNLVIDEAAEELRRFALASVKAGGNA